MMYREKERVKDILRLSPRISDLHRVFRYTCVNFQFILFHSAMIIAFVGGGEFIKCKSKIIECVLRLQNTITLWWMMKTQINKLGSKVHKSMRGYSFLKSAESVQTLFLYQTVNLTSFRNNWKSAEIIRNQFWLSEINRIYHQRHMKSYETIWHPVR